MVPKPLRRLGLPYEPAFISTRADGQVLMSAKESRKSKGKVEGQKSEGNQKSKNEAKSCR
ncbi:hypothetical protein K440DRAFT_622838, partial [Wilcoxina mikolae CBS 423.85]